MGFKTQRRGLGSIILILLWFTSTLAQAQVSVTPSRAVAELGLNETLDLSWQVMGSGAGTQARSDAGVLLDLATGQILRQVPLALATTAPGTVREQLLLSRQDLDRASAMGFTQLAYQRRWRESTGAQSQAAVRIAIASSQRSGLQIRDLRLEFANGAPEILVAGQGEDIRARAIISFAGRDGLLSYEWQLASPVSTRTQARFFILQQGQQNLRGRSPFVLESPALPSQLLGPYQLRLVLRGPQARQAELKYWIRSSASSQSLSQQYPLAGAQIDLNGLFSWRGVAGASAYQLEIYRKQERISGVLLPADAQPSAVLPAVATKHLREGCECQWRVLAYNAEGEVAAVSPLRSVRIQAAPPVARSADAKGTNQEDME